MTNPNPPATGPSAADDDIQGLFSRFGASAAAYRNFDHPVVEGPVRPVTVLVRRDAPTAPAATVPPAPVDTPLQQLFQRLLQAAPPADDSRPLRRVLGGH